MPLRTCRLGRSAVDDVNLSLRAHVFVAAEATTHKDATATPKRMSGYGPPMGVRRATSIIAARAANPL